MAPARGVTGRPAPGAERYRVLVASAVDGGAEEDAVLLVGGLAARGFMVGMSREQEEWEQGRRGVDVLLVDLACVTEEAWGPVVSASRAEGGRSPVVIALVRDVAEEARSMRAGCDDAVRLPWDVGVVALRIERAMGNRRRSWMAPLASPNTPVDARTHRARTFEASVAFSRKETQLLDVLLTRPGMAVSRRELLDSVWGEGYGGTPRVLDVRISDIRRKLGPQASLMIETVHGVGYRYAPRTHPLT